MWNEWIRHLHELECMRTQARAVVELEFHRSLHATTVSVHLFSLSFYHCNSVIMASHLLRASLRAIARPATRKVFTTATPSLAPRMMAVARPMGARFMSSGTGKHAEHPYCSRWSVFLMVFPSRLWSCPQTQRGIAIWKVHWRILPTRVYQWVLGCQPVRGKIRIRCIVYPRWHISNGSVHV